MKTFQFQVGDKVGWKKCPDPATGIIIARGRYTARAEEFMFTAGDRYYLIDGLGGGDLRVVVEEFLKRAR